MEKNIYDLINEITTDIDENEEIKLTKFEEKKMMKKFSETVRQNGSQTRNYKKYVGIASAAVIAFGTIGMIPSMASNNPTMYKIATFLGMEKELAPYETVVGQEVTKDGVTMMINEVIINNDQLLVSVTTQLDETMKENFIGPAGFVYINGEEINQGASGKSKILEDGTGLTLLTFPLGEVPQGDVDVKVSLRTPMTNVEKSAHWDFEFNANGEALTADTQIVEIDKVFEVENEVKVTLNQYEGNKVGHRIIYTRQPDEKGIIEVKGTDEKGNEVVFQADGIFDGTGELVLAPEYNSVVEEAQNLTLGVYVGDEQIGETFEINK